MAIRLPSRQATDITEAHLDVDDFAGHDESGDEGWGGEGGTETMRQRRVDEKAQRTLRRRGPRGHTQRQLDDIRLASWRPQLLLALITHYTNGYMIWGNNVQSDE